MISNKTCRQKLGVVESQRDALLLAKLRDATLKSTLALPTVTSPTPESTPSVSPFPSIPTPPHNSPPPSHSSPKHSHHPSTLSNHLPYAPISRPSIHLVLSPPTTKHAAENLHTCNLLHNDALHRGSLRSWGSLHTEISLAAEEKVGDLGLTERLLHARLNSLGSP